MRGFTVLTAEIAFRHGETKIARTTPDFSALKKTGRPIGLAIRIAPHAGPFREDDEFSRAIVGLARERLAEARRGGLEPVELQVDFDCAEAKLDGYRLWLRALRAAVRPLPVCPTVLPSWLAHAEFAALARESGRFVLQVHSVEPPRERARLGPLCDPARARSWVERAARVGVPFRVALPTYTYLLAFDRAGKVRGISAEGPSAQWPADSQVVRWESAPDDLAALVAEWARDRPANLTGVIWYRLPVAGDALNWRWPTLAAVMEGRAPASRLRLESSDAQPSELIASNDGERDEALPELVEARWDGARLVASDALENYELEPSSRANSLVFRRLPGAALSRLPPGARRPIGWIRCEPQTSIQLVARVPSPPADAPAADATPGPRDGF